MFYTCSKCYCYSSVAEDFLAPYIHTRAHVIDFVYIPASTHTRTQEQTKIEWIHISHNTSLSLLGITVSISTLQPIILTKKTIHYRPQFPVLLPLLCQNHHFVLRLHSHLNS